MKKLVIAFVITSLLLVVAGCAKPVTQSLNIPEVPQGQDERLFYASLSKTWIEQKEPDLMKAIDLYKKLIELYPVNDPIRRDFLHYITDANLFMITQDRKAEEGLKIAFELDKIIPNDFYIQNRILAAYRVLAEDAMAKGDLVAANDYLYNKALRIRFDAEVMRTLLKLRMEQAKEEIAAGKKDEAKARLQDAYMIATIEDNKDLFPEEAKQIAALLKTIK